jgi:hypothetical protein
LEGDEREARRRREGEGGEEGEEGGKVNSRLVMVLTCCTDHKEIERRNEYILAL